MSDVKVEQKQTLSREEAARFVAALADGLSDHGNVSVRLGSSVLQLSVAAQVDCELEVSVDGNEIELELELKWSTSGTASADAADEEANEDDAELDDAEVDEAEVDEAVGGEADGGAAEADKGQPDEAGPVQLEEEPDGHDSGNDVSELEPSVDDSRDSESDLQTVGSTRAESPRAVPADRTSLPRRSRRSASAGSGHSASNGVDTAAVRASAQPRRGRRTGAAATDKPTFNGVDAAAVRAWAAANGLTVSPRGRIKEEVIEAYRAAGN